MKKTTQNVQRVVYSLTAAEVIEAVMESQHDFAGKPKAIVFAPDGACTITFEFAEAPQPAATLAELEEARR